MVLFEEIGEVGRHFRNKWCTHLKGYSLSRIFLTKLERIGFGFGFFNVLEMNIWRTIAKKMLYKFKSIKQY